MPAKVAGSYRLHSEKFVKEQTASGLQSPVSDICGWCGCQARSGCFGVSDERLAWLSNHSSSVFFLNSLSCLGTSNAVEALWSLILEYSNNKTVPLLLHPILQYPQIKAHWGLRVKEPSCFCSGLISEQQGAVSLQCDQFIHLSDIYGVHAILWA